MDRREFLRLTGGAAILGAGFTAMGRRPALAQEKIVLADLGLPELSLTLNDDGLEVVPTETEAGWHLVTFTNAITPTGDPFEDSWSVEFALLPEDKTVDDLAAALVAMFEGEGGPPAETEEGGDAASPAADSEDPFAWANQLWQPGGPGARQGETTQALIHLVAGNYGVLVPFFGAPEPLTVTEADAAASADVDPEIAVDVVITETGTSGTFDFAVESGAYAGGPAVVEVVNDSDQPHFIIAMHSANPITEDEVMALLMAGEGGTPPPGAPDPVQPSLGFVTGTQSPGTTQYLALDLEPGYYALLCFVGDPNQGGVPHSIAGMIEVVPIGV